MCSLFLAGESISGITLVSQGHLQKKKIGASVIPRFGAILTERTISGSTLMIQINHSISNNSIKQKFHMSFANLL